MTKRNRNSSGPIGFAPWILAVGPPLMIAATIHRWATDTPLNDEWAAVPLLVKAREGTLGFADVWAQHNEHRLVLQRLFLVGLARFSDWDIRWELAANVLVAMATLVVHALLIRRTVTPFGRTLPGWLVVVASALVFSFTQYENWIWGWTMSAFFLMFVTAAGALALTYGGRSVVAMVVCAIVAPLCYGSGLLLSFILAGGVLLDPIHGSRKERIRKAVMLGGLGLAVAAAYTYGLERIGDHSSVFSPRLYTRYVLAYLGAPLSREVFGATLWGLIGLLMLASSLVWLHRRSPRYRSVLVPWGALASFAILSAMLTGIGRVRFGIEQALASRYVTITTPFWIGACIFVSLVLVEHLRDESLSRARLTAVTALVSVIGALGASSFVRASTGDASRLGAWSNALLENRECVIGYRGAPDDCLHLFMPSLHGGDPAYVRARSADLERLALGPFRRAVKPPSVAEFTLVESPGAGYLDRFEMVPRMGGLVMVSGWAADPVKHTQVESVLVTVDGESFGLAVMGLARADLEQLVDPRLGHAGWHFIFRAFRVAPGPHLFTAYALLGEGRATQLGGSQSFDVQP
jgi:hypothetical protein